MNYNWGKKKKDILNKKKNIRNSYTNRTLDCSFVWIIKKMSDKTTFQGIRISDRMAMHAHIYTCLYERKWPHYNNWMFYGTKKPTKAIRMKQNRIIIKKKILYEQRNKKAIAILEYWNTWLIFHATNTKSKNCAHTTILYFNVKVIYWTCIEFVCSFKCVCVCVGVRMCIRHSFVHDDDKKSNTMTKNDHNAPKMLSSERILNENNFGFRRFQEHSKGLLNWYMNFYLNGRFWLLCTYK